MKLVHAAFFICFIFASCRGVGPGNLFSGKSPHEQYADRLKRAGLDGHAAGKQWMNAANDAISTPVSIALPYEEQGYFDGAKPSSTGLKFSARQGERLTIRLSKIPDTGFTIFMDLWQVDGSNQKLLASSDTAGVLKQDVAQSTSYLIRLQPELLGSGSYALSITTGPSLAYPVTNPKKHRVGSFWGAERDAGARSHEGIDIFAPRGTPALAAADGRVTSVRTGGLGGKQVWMRPDGQSYNLYYAHLDTQIAVDGQTVRMGDTLGLVGNTGNASRTVPHLHFGIYSFGGAVDPFPFVNPDSPKPEAPTAPASLIGKKARTGTATPLLISNQPKAETVISLPARNWIQVEGAAGKYVRVVLPDGQKGWLPLSAVKPLSESTGETILRRKILLLDAPDSNAAPKRTLQSGTAITELAVFKDYRFVRTNDEEGWLRRD